MECKSILRAVGDCEVLSNFFSCTFVDFDSDESIVFEVSERKNELVAFVEFVLKVTYFISFNGLHYDSPIIMYVVKNIGTLKDEPWDTVTQRIKSLSDCIIDDEGENYKKYSKYKYPHYCQVDLFAYWSKLTRVSRKLSLKSFAINLNWPRVQEFPLHHTALIRLDQIDGFLSYNMNDVLVTKALAIHMRKDINLRVAARSRYGFQCLSWDGVKLGLNILVKRYCDRTGRDMKEVSQLRTHRDQVVIADILLPVIEFRQADSTYVQFIDKGALITQFKSFYGLWQYLKGLVVTDAKSINCRVLYHNVRYDVKSGGLHSYHNPGVIKRMPGYRYVDKDVSSMYPTISCMWGIGPAHLGPEAPEELDVMRCERLSLKAQGLGKSSESELIKLSMNGGWYGNMNNEYTPMQDLVGLLGTTINGQLMLMMFCQDLIDIGAVIDMVNTDGATIMYPESIHEEVERVSKAWEQKVRMELEAVNYTKVVRRDINNYIAFYEGGVKEKGMFQTDPGIDMSHDFLVIPKAIRAYFEHSTPVEQFILDHREIYDFCGSMKCDKSYDVYWNSKVQQHLNRFFVTKGGAYLYKSRDGINMNHMLKDNPVQLFNDYFEAPWEDYKINYSFYVSKCKEIISELEPVQTSLFG